MPIAWHQPHPGHHSLSLPTPLSPLHCPCRRHVCLRVHVEQPDGRLHRGRGPRPLVCTVSGYESQLEEPATPRMSPRTTRTPFCRPTVLCSICDAHGYIRPSAHGLLPSVPRLCPLGAAMTAMRASATSRPSAAGPARRSSSTPVMTPSAASASTSESYAVRTLLAPLPLPVFACFVHVATPC